MTWRQRDARRQRPSEAQQLRVSGSEPWHTIRSGQRCSTLCRVACVQTEVFAQRTEMSMSSQSSSSPEPTHSSKNPTVASRPVRTLKPLTRLLAASPPTIRACDTTEKGQEPDRE